MLEDAFRIFSNTFTKDCNKAHKGKELKWHRRNEGKMNSVWQRTNDRIGC